MAEKSIVIIPTYNEKENIKRLIEEIKALAMPALDILIVDDNSPDGTGALVESLAKNNNNLFVLHRPKKLGLASAYIEGFKLALSRGYDYVFQMDADLSHDPKDLLLMQENKKDYDLIIGSRYVTGGGIDNWAKWRFYLSKVANLYASLATRVKIKDLTGGFKMFRREVLESIDLNSLKSDGYCFQIEMNVWAARKNYKIKEVPIIFHERRQGKSKISKKIIWEALWRVWSI